MKLFSKAKKAKFLLNVIEGDLLNNNKDSLKNTISKFFSYFNLEKLSVNNIINHTSLVVTQVDINNEE